MGSIVCIDWCDDDCRTWSGWLYLRTTAALMHFGHYSDVPTTAWRWKHFTPEEIASKGDGSILIDEPALDKLERLRVALGRPLVVLSAYRDPLHNARVGGAPLSQHKFGRAFDLKLTVDRDLLIRTARDVGFGGIGIYSTFVHVDDGPSRKWQG